MPPIKELREIYSLSLVFIGDFNPVIIQPFWLAHKQLIMEREAESSQVELIHNDLVRFDLEWGFLEVTKKRIEIKTTSEAHFEIIRDLLASIFKILKETPITELGINHLQHYSIPDEGLYKHIGDVIAPLGNWTGVLEDPRVSVLEIIDKKKSDTVPGVVRVKVTPSDQKLSSRYGLLINVNDNYALRTGQWGRDCEMVNALLDNWNNSFKLAENIAESLWQRVNK